MLLPKYKPGLIVYMIESNHQIRQVRILKRESQYCVVKYLHSHISIRESKDRLYFTFEEAKAAVESWEKYKDLGL